MSTRKAVRFADGEEVFDIATSLEPALDADNQQTPPGSVSPTTLPSSPLPLASSSPVLPSPLPSPPTRPLRSLRLSPPPSVSEPLPNIPQLHPALCRTSGQPLSFAFDLSQPLALQDIDPDLLLQRASDSPKAMKITNEYLPWEIVVRPQRGSTWVTVQDLLSSLHEQMRGTAKVAEVDACPFREAVLMTRDARDPRQQVRRLDFLLGKYWFAGLDLLDHDDPDDNCWRLYVDVASRDI